MVSIDKSGWFATALAGCLLAGAAGAVPMTAFAQQRAPTTDDYARAERMLMQHTLPLVDHAVTGVRWPDDGHVAWIESGDGAMQFRRLDGASGEVTPAFDHAWLAKALAKASGKPVDAKRLDKVITKLDWTDDGQIEVSLREGVAYLCAPKGKCSKRKPLAKTGEEPGVRSPDGKSDAFIRDWNLWLRDVASGNETQLTFDGKTDYGYATDNAGWKHTDDAVLVWSPDGSRIATFRQDQRKTSTMTLVGTNVGVPKVEQWKYPFVGDENVTMIERVIIDLSGDKPRTVRLQMPPDQHRSTCADDLVCSEGWEDVQWAPDGKTLAFVSTDRGHKSATLRVADAATGAVRDVFEETVDTQYQSAPALDSVNWRYLPESNEFLWFSQKSYGAICICTTLPPVNRKRRYLGD